MFEDILMSTADRVATITFNRPKVVNALSEEMRHGLHHFLSEAEADANVRCVVLRGTGGNFMAGGDVKSFSAGVAVPAEERRRIFEARIHGLHPMIFLMRRMSKPIIACVEGACAGVGVSFAMACDLIIAADSAFFTLAYIRIGTSPDGSSTFFLPRIVGLKKAMEIALLGDRFDAATAKDIGLVNFVVPAATIESETAKLAGRLVRSAPAAIARTKALLHASLQNTVESQLAAEAVAFSECAATEDWTEGVQAFVQKRQPNFQGK